MQKAQYIKKSIFENHPLSFCEKKEKCCKKHKKKGHFCKKCPKI